ncbi:hypothetical protein JHW43_007943 [Diplocarpon mali]|nr:hypothetical protein JHW43_007943 [Diplocarpon mali]
MIERCLSAKDSHGFPHRRGSPEAAERATGRGESSFCREQLHTWPFGRHEILAIASRDPSQDETKRVMLERVPAWPGLASRDSIPTPGRKRSTRHCELPLPDRATASPPPRGRVLRIPGNRKGGPTEQTEQTGATAPFLLGLARRRGQPRVHVSSGLGFVTSPRPRREPRHPAPLGKYAGRQRPAQRDHRPASESSGDRQQQQQQQQQPYTRGTATGRGRYQDRSPGRGGSGMRAPSAAAEGARASPRDGCGSSAWFGHPSGEKATELEAPQRPLTDLARTAPQNCLAGGARGRRREGERARSGRCEGAYAKKPNVSLHEVKERCHPVGASGRQWQRPLRVRQC